MLAVHEKNVVWIHLIKLGGEAFINLANVILLTWKVEIAALGETFLRPWRYYKNNPSLSSK